MNCPNCNAPIQDGNEFCATCGTKLSVLQRTPVSQQKFTAGPSLSQQNFTTEPTRSEQNFSTESSSASRQEFANQSMSAPRQQFEETNFCPYCNAVIESGNTFCMSCGADLSAPAQNRTQYAPTRSPINSSAPAANSGNFCGKGVASLVLSLVSLFFAFSCASIFISGICGILGIVFGALGMKQARAQNLSGRGLAIAGLVIGIISTVFSCLYGFLLFIGAVAYLM